MQIQRDKVTFQEKEQKYKQNVAKVKNVQKTATQNFQTKGGRKYGLFGPR